MNIQLRRKQILILGMAMLLAVASFWIPMPQQSAPQNATPERSKPVGGSGAAEAIVYAREPASAWRFAVSEHMPKSAPAGEGAAIDPAVPGEVSAATRWLDPRELGNGAPARLGDKALILPVKNLEQPRKP